MKQFMFIWLGIVLFALCGIQVFDTMDAHAQEKKAPQGSPRNRSGAPSIKFGLISPREARCGRDMADATRLTFRA